MFFSLSLAGVEKEEKWEFWREALSLKAFPLPTTKTGKLKEKRPPSAAVIGFREIFRLLPHFPQFSFFPRNL